MDHVAYTLVEATHKSNKRVDGRDLNRVTGTLYEQTVANKRTSSGRPRPQLCIKYSMIKQSRINKLRVDDPCGAADLPMLECVGKAHAVSPSDALRARAEKEGWPVLTWKEEYKRGRADDDDSRGGGGAAAAAGGGGGGADSSPGQQPLAA